MIRPFTLACMVAAAGSGLYLYQTKHQAQMLDREIARASKAADAARERASEKRAEYALLNDPSRLQELASAHLVSLQETAPTQFTTMAEFDRRLPPVGAAPVEPPPLEPQAPAAKLPTAADAKPVGLKPDAAVAPAPSVMSQAHPATAAPLAIAAVRPASPVRVAARPIVPQAPAWIASMRAAPSFDARTGNAGLAGRNRQALASATPVSAVVSYVAPNAYAPRAFTYNAASYRTADARGFAVPATAPVVPVTVSALGMARSLTSEPVYAPYRTTAR